MNTQHTPGPWHVHIGSPSIVRDEDGSFVAEGCSNADARLIAAAPDLLAACEDLLAAYHGLTLGRQDTEWEGQFKVKARAAIAKAKGEA